MAEETEEAAGGPRSQMFKHEAMVTWINEQDGIDLDTLSAAEIISYAYARRVAWRKTEAYRTLVEEYAGSAEARKAEAVAEREAAKEARAEEREAARAVKDAEKAEKAAAKEAAAEAAQSEPKPEKATKATKTPAKATKANKKASDSPFE